MKATVVFTQKHSKAMCHNHRSVLNIPDSLLANQIPAKGLVTIDCRIEIRKKGGMLISQPISRCLTNHSELCMSRMPNNHPRRISIYRLQRRPSFGFESSVSSTPMTSGDPMVITISQAKTTSHTVKHKINAARASIQIQCKISNEWLTFAGLENFQSFISKSTKF